MELDEFVSQSLINIIKGIKAAQKQAAKDDAIIYPAKLLDGVSSEKMSRMQAGGLKTQRIVSLVEFDLAVTVNDKAISISSVSAGIVPVLGGKAQGTEESGEEYQSRIRFTIPVAFPGQE